MDPKTAVSGSVNLAHAGIYSVWTGEDLGTSLINSPQSSIRSQSTLVSDTVDARTPNTNTAPREPVNQTSAAWTSLRNTQHQLPRTSSALNPPSQPAKSDTGIADQAFSTGVEAINRRRGDRIPQKFAASRKSAHRNLILAICGEQGSDEVNR